MCVHLQPRERKSAWLRRQATKNTAAIETEGSNPDGLTVRLVCISERVTKPKRSNIN